MARAVVPSRAEQRSAPCSELLLLFPSLWSQQLMMPATVSPDNHVATQLSPMPKKQRKAIEQIKKKKKTVRDFMKIVSGKLLQWKPSRLRDSYAKGAVVVSFLDSLEELNRKYVEFGFSKELWEPAYNFVKAYFRQPLLSINQSSLPDAEALDCQIIGPSLNDTMKTSFARLRNSCFPTATAVANPAATSQASMVGAAPEDAKAIFNGALTQLKAAAKSGAKLTLSLEGEKKRRKLAKILERKLEQLSFKKRNPGGQTAQQFEQLEKLMKTAKALAKKVTAARADWGFDPQKIRSPGNMNSLDADQKQILGIGLMEKSYQRFEEFINAVRCNDLPEDPKGLDKDYVQFACGVLVNSFIDRYHSSVSSASSPAATAGTSILASLVPTDRVPVNDRFQMVVQFAQNPGKFNFSSAQHFEFWTQVNSDNRWPEFFEWLDTLGPEQREKLSRILANIKVSNKVPGQAEQISMVSSLLSMMTAHAAD